MRIKYLQIATDKGLVVCEQVDSDEVMMLIEERNVLDDGEIKNEVTELEFENDGGMNNGTIEENLPETAEVSVLDTVKFLPLEKVKIPIWQLFGFPARSGEYVEKDKRRRKEVFCALCKNPLNYTGSTTNMIVYLQYCHLAEYNEFLFFSNQSPVTRLKLQNYLKGSNLLNNLLEK